MNLTFLNGLLNQLKDGQVDRLPINFRYSIGRRWETQSQSLNSGFTVAYCTISNEHYEGETPTSKEQPVSKTEASSTSAHTAASTPAFTLAGAISVFALVFVLLRR